MASLRHDPLQLAVQPYIFEAQMEYLAENFNVVSVDELKMHIEAAAPFDPGSVVITFDGGYAETLYTAGAVLERLNLSAVVSVPSAGLIERRPPWPVELEEMLIAGNPRACLSFEIGGREYRWPLRNQRDTFIAFDRLYSILVDEAPAEQQNVIEQIRLCLGRCADESDSHATVDARELRELDESELITIGGHLHDCVKLSALPRWRQIEELAKNKTVLEEVLGHGVEYLSYPFGSEGGHDAGLAELLEDMGFTLAFGDCYGTISASASVAHYDLPRVKVGNWNPFTFHRFLEGFFT